MTTREASPESTLEPCRTSVLQALDRCLEQHPATPEPVLLDVTRCVVHLRDALIAEHRRAPSAETKQELAHTNSVLSLVLSVHFPLQGVHWEKLKHVRDSLAQLQSGLRASQSHPLGRAEGPAPSR